MVFGALGAVVGYIINGVLGLIVGMFAMMVIGALIGPSASKNSKPPAVRVVEDQANILPRAVETGKASTDQQAPKISSTAEARLAHLKELLDKRLISQSEYDQKRAKIIDDI